MAKKVSAEQRAKNLLPYKDAITKEFGEQGIPNVQDPTMAQLEKHLKECGHGVEDCTELNKQLDNVTLLILACGGDTKVSELYTVNHDCESDPFKQLRGVPTERRTMAKKKVAKKK